MYKLKLEMNTCPTIWEGENEKGELIEVYYRSGVLRITYFEKDDESIKGIEIYRKRIGDFIDCTISIDAIISILDTLGYKAEEAL